jgi:FlaA1/EpsC-like NDP-sugar epimerase
MNRKVRDIVIAGAGGFGKEVAWLIGRINARSPAWRILGFLDDDAAKHGASRFGLPVLGGLDRLEGRRGAACAVAIGDPRARRRAVRRLEAWGVEFPCLVHPDVAMDGGVTMKDGAIVCAGNLLTVEISLGRHVHLNLA